MKDNLLSQKISQYVKNVQESGLIYFSGTEIRRELDDFPGITVSHALEAMVRKGNLFVAFRGFYVIISDEFRKRKKLPSPALYLDALMLYLKRPYYVGLLTAVAIHAKKRLPNDFYVFTVHPRTMNVAKTGKYVRFFYVDDFPENFTTTVTTSKGKFMVSLPELTALDLVYHVEDLGGWDKILPALNRLIPTLNFAKCDVKIFTYTNLSNVQRLGFLIEHVFHKKTTASGLFVKARNNFNTFKYILLDPSSDAPAMPTRSRWRIYKNVELKWEK